MSFAEQFSEMLKKHNKEFNEKVTKFLNDNAHLLGENFEWKGKKYIVTDIWFDREVDDDMVFVPIVRVKHNFLDYFDIPYHLWFLSNISIFKNDYDIKKLLIDYLADEEEKNEREQRTYR